MRLFAGLPLSGAANRDTAALAAHAEAAITGRYVLASNYHMTLVFLGEVPEARLEDAKQAVRAFAARFPAPLIKLAGLSYFREPSNAILIRTVQSPDDLAAMHDALAAQLDAHALPHTDGPFSPHVTLARHVNLTGVSAGELAAPPISFTATHAVLYLSARDDAGVLRYTPLLRAAFQQP